MRQGRPLLPQTRRFPLHLGVFCAIAGLGLLANIGFDAGLPLFWPLMGWAAVLAVHYFIASSLDVDEAWVEERSEELRTRSYDFDHIENIKDRVKKRDDSVTHHAERDK